MLAEIIDFFYPPRCAACGQLMANGTRELICESCLRLIEWVTEPLCATCGIPLDGGNADSAKCVPCASSPPRFGRARSIACYRADAEREDDTLGSIIRRHKYALDQSLGRTLARFAREYHPYRADEYDLIVPVPLHSSRLRWRGFNQAALLGQAVARDLGLPFEATNLRRVKATAPQTGMDRASRARNVRGAFAVAKPKRISGRRIMLIDDVMTTGATAEECARVLVSAGAARVDVLTLARAV